MGPKKNETPDASRRIDPDANPLTSFGRDSEFIDELIQGFCEKKAKPPGLKTNSGDDDRKKVKRNRQKKRGIH